MKVCIADDDPVYRRMLASILDEWGYEVLIAEDGEAAWQILGAANAPRLAVLDWVMPGLDGVELCRRLRQHPQGKLAYLLLLTVKDSLANLVQGLQDGADDYLVKPFEPLELQARLNVGRRLLAVQEELITAREAMRVQATTDSLTGVWNRRSILEILERELSRGVRDGSPVSIVMADLDHFKQVNDSLGHQAGDAVLRETVRRIAAATRPYDAVGRYGGEEFLVVLPGCGLTEAAGCAERMRGNVADQPVSHLGQQIPATLSLGVAVFPASEDSSVSALLRTADGALYDAKRGGRNRVGMPAVGGGTLVEGLR